MTGTLLLNPRCPQTDNGRERVENKVLAMHAKGISQRDIAEMVGDIYGFEISHETTDRVVKTANKWQNRPPKKFYTFLFVNCLYVSIRKEIYMMQYLKQFRPHGHLTMKVYFTFIVNGDKKLLSMSSLDMT